MVRCVFKVDRHTYMGIFYLNKGSWEHASGVIRRPRAFLVLTAPQADTVAKRPGFIAKHNAGLHGREIL